MDILKRSILPALLLFVAVFVLGAFMGWSFRDRQAETQEYVRAIRMDSLSAAAVIAQRDLDSAIARRDALEALVQELAEQDKPTFIYLRAREKWNRSSGAAAMRFLRTRPDSLLDIYYPRKVERR